MNLEPGKIFLREDGTPVHIHEVLIQETVGMVVGMANDGLVPVQIKIAVGRSPNLRGRLYFFADSGKRIGTNGSASDLNREHTGRPEEFDNE